MFVDNLQSTTLRKESKIMAKTSMSVSVNPYALRGILSQVGSFLQNILTGFFDIDSINPEQLKVTFPPSPDMGDFAFACFQCAKLLGMSPAECAKKMEEIAKIQLANGGEHISSVIEKVCASGPYLNIYLNREKTSDATIHAISEEKNGYGMNSSLSGKTMMVEYLSPNTNKPLHMGHMRNGVIGTTIARLLQANGARVIAANNINDRGIHIAKSMMAYRLWGNGETPDSTGEKGDHFVGRFYVMYSQEEARLKKEWLTAKGIPLDGTNREEAERQFEKECTLVQQCYKMLNQWEAHEPSVIELWRKMNQWVYDGFEQTNRRLGFFFDTVYYESNTYKLGKQIVLEKFDQGIGQKSKKGIEIDLTDVKLGQKPILLLRADGTSVYMTQDIGLAPTRFAEIDFDKVIYVVGSEQDFHFKCLFEIFKRYGFSWQSRLYHLSYGMVILPSGKMKSREGTVVDADDLIDQLRSFACDVIKENKTDISVDELGERAETIALGALKYMLASASPSNDILFDPQKSVSFEGNTGPYLQYACVRITAIEEKALNFTNRKNADDLQISDKEFEIVKKLSLYPDAVRRGADSYDTSVLTNCLYDIARSFSAFYAECPVVRDNCVNAFRLNLCQATRQVLSNGLQLLGIPIPDRM